ncbi:MAG: uroporphyrinogen decarboxylase family protein, partial [Actinomycetota bacterium]|nr:uroporphyrinogen decarboxylase family protein [Actinomycetota bacterium]
CGDVKALGGVLDRVAARAISIDSNVSFRTLRGLAPTHTTMGNVSTYLLEYGDPDTLRQVASNCVREEVGIIAPACGIGPRTPVANIRAVAEVVVGTPLSETVVSGHLATV